jgi:hypothetical protein
VGQTTGKLNLKLDQNPIHEKLEIEMQCLDLSNLILFARDVSQTDIPDIPHTNVLYFKDLSLCIASNPPNLDFRCQVDIFAHEANARASINADKGIAMAGEIPSFQVGPLKVTGAEGDDAKFDIEICVATQKIQINGRCDMGEAGFLAACVDIQHLPEPKFDLSIETDFLSRTMKLLGTMVGPPLQGNKTEMLDFILHAAGDQMLLDYLNQHADEAIKTLLHVSEVDIAAQAIDLANQRRGLVEALDEASAALRVAEAAWDKKRNETHAALEKARKDIDAELASLSSKATEAHVAFNNEVKRLEAAWETEKRNAAASINKAEQAISDAARAGEQTLERLRRDPADRRRELEATFGNVDRAIEDARREVNKAQGKQLFFNLLQSLC